MSLLLFNKEQTMTLERINLERPAFSQASQSLLLDKSSWHWVINITNKHFIHASLERGLEFLSVYLNANTCANPHLLDDLIVILNMYFFEEEALRGLQKCWPLKRPRRPRLIRVRVCISREASPTLLVFHLSLDWSYGQELGNSAM